MNIVKSLAVISLGLFAVVAPVSAVPINITNDLGNPAGLLIDYDKGIVGALGDADIAIWLRSEILKYNADLNPGADLPLPSIGDLGSGSSGLFALNLTGFSYAVLHYGKGPGGVGDGGGLQAFYLNGTTGSYTFPASGSGPNGFGGISFARLYGPTISTVPAPSVPDGGATIVLLGSVLAVFGLARRFSTALLPA